MTTQEIIREINLLPFGQQRQVLAEVQLNLSRPQLSDEEQREEAVAQMLLALGLIKEIPSGWDDDEDFEPIEISGPPLSETIIAERR